MKSNYLKLYNDYNNLEKKFDQFKKDSAITSENQERSYGKIDEIEIDEMKKQFSMTKPGQNWTSNNLKKKTFWRKHFLTNQ